MFDMLGKMLGQDIGGYAQGPMPSGSAGVPRTGINYADVLKKLGMVGASGQDQQDMGDVEGINSLINLWGGGLGLGGGQSGGM